MKLTVISRLALYNCAFSLTFSSTAVVTAKLNKKEVNEYFDDIVFPSCCHVF